MPDHGGAMLMGDLALAETEIGPVMKRLVAGGAARYRTNPNAHGFVKGACAATIGLVAFPLMHPAWVLVR